MKRGWIDYKLIYKIEGKYGSLANCPEDCEYLRELRKKMNVNLGMAKYPRRTGSWRDYKRQAEKVYN